MSDFDEDDELEDEDWESDFDDEDDDPVFPSTPFQNYLEAHDACFDARDWVDEQTVEQAWDGCPDLGWMQWLLERTQRVRCETCGWSHVHDCEWSRMIEFLTPQDLRIRYGTPYFDEAGELQWRGGTIEGVK